MEVQANVKLIVVQVILRTRIHKNVRPVIKPIPFVLHAPIVLPSVYHALAVTSLMVKAV